MTTWFIPPSILGFNSIRNELDWAQNELQIPGHELLFSEACDIIGMHAYSARARPYAKCNHGKSYIISKPRMLAFQCNWNRIIWTSIAQVMVNWVRRGQAWQHCGSFISSWVLPLCMLFSSLLPSNTCLMNLKSLNKHIKASNGIKVS